MLLHHAPPSVSGCARLLTLLPLKVTCCPHECYALVHNPFAKVEVLVDEGANIRGLDFVSSNTVERLVSAGRLWSDMEVLMK